MRVEIMPTRGFKKKVDPDLREESILVRLHEQVGKRGPFP